MNLHKKHFLIAFVFFVAALFIYIFKLSEISSGFHGDEAWISLFSEKIARREVKDIFGVGIAYHPILSFFPQAFSFSLLGTNIFAARLPSALLSALSVPVFYLLVLYLINFRTAFFSTLLFATSHLWIAMSRLATNNTQVVFFELVSFFLLFKALRTRRNIFFIFLGISTSLTFYLYAGFRVVPIIIGLVLLKELLSNKQRLKLIKQIGLAFFFFLVFSAPQLFFFLKHPYTFVDRGRSIFVFGESGEASEWREANYKGESFGKILLAQAQKTFLFFARGDTSGQYGHTGPLLNPGLSFLFIVGVLITIRHLRETKHTFFILWFFLTMSAGNLIMIDPFFLPRATGALPVIYILIGVGLNGLIKSSENLPKKFFKVSLVFLFILAFTLAILNLYTYFVESERKMFGDINKYRATRIAKFLNSLGSQYKAIFLTAPQMTPEFFSFKFLLKELNYKNFDNPYEYRVEAVSRSIFVIDPEYREKLDEIEDKNPNGKLIVEQDNLGRPLLFFYKVD